MKAKFEEISKQVNGTFNFLENKVNSGIGVKDYQAEYSIDFEYENELIHLKNFLGLKSFGTIESQMTAVNNIQNFTIETKSQLKRLFSINKECFKLTTQNMPLHAAIKGNKDFNELMKLVKDTSFEPSITGELIIDKFVIRTEYHLLLPEREAILKPLIEFHKFLIKTLKKES